MTNTTYYNETKDQRMRSVLEKIIERGRTRGLNVIERIQREVPQDRVAKAAVIDFVPDEKGIFVQVPIQVIERANGDAGDLKQPLHRNARNQVIERAELKLEFANMLEEKGAWGRELLAHTLNQLYHHQPANRYLVRSYNDEVRGFLSNRFRRIDSRPIIESLAKAATVIGAVPTDGVGTDTRVALTVVLPRIFVINGASGYKDYVAWGFSWQNSDYGNGAHSLREFFIRVLCENGATGEETLREVHLGGQLKEEDVWSSRTLRLDTQRSASMVDDAVRGYLGPAKLEEKVRLLEKAASESVDLKNKNVTEWLKKQLGAGKAKEVVEAFNSPDVENLPPGNTSWRLSNAISWLAGKTDDGDRKLELMQVAGDVLGYLGSRKAV